MKKTGDKDEKLVVIDVDNTLLMWRGNYEESGKNKVKIVDPLDNKIYYLYPNKENIRLVQHFYNRDYYVIVHSASGGRWAKAAVKALNLEDYVHDTQAKPLKYVDDLDASEWMGNRVYIDYEEEK